MNNRTRMLQFLKPLKRRLLWLHTSSYVGRFFFYAVLMSLALTVVSRFIVIPFLYRYFFIAYVLTFIVVVVIAVKRKPTVALMIHKFDEWVGEERVTTAYSFIEKEQTIANLQREDTFKRMQKQQNVVISNQKMTWSYSKIVMSICAAILIFFSFLIPSETMLSAKVKEEEQKIIDEVKDKMEELADEDSNELDDLKNQLDELETADEVLDELLVAEQKLEDLKQELLQKEQELQALLENEQNFQDLDEALQSEDLNQLNQALEELKGSPELLQKLQDGLLDNRVNVDGLSEEELNELLEQLKDALEEGMQLGDEVAELRELQEGLQELALSQQRSMSQAGIGSQRRLSFERSQSEGTASTQPGNSSENSNGQSEGTDNNGNAGNGESLNGDRSEGNGSGDGGQSNGAGQGGSGTGSGNGSGSGAGTGSGTGQGGSGSGAGIGEGSRELLTVPERIGGEGDVEQDLTELGEGEGTTQETNQAPTLKGEVRSYQEVIGQYEQIYRESVERNTLPSHLEEMIEKYFSEL
ncbi:hypothetical protein, partial [Alkalihalobacillus pseudalcaliphilus]|uniref:hypothetical protein n=1 Tax=Alkalihalobacillus pseudalcaliphilus TaxID=79884 RepID=UPI002360FC7B